MIVTLAPKPSRTALPDAKLPLVALIGDPPIVVLPVPSARRFEIEAVVFAGIDPDPIELVIDASEGTKLDVEVTVVPGENWVLSDEPNEVLVPNDKLDFDPVCRDMLIVCPFGAGTTSGSFCATTSRGLISNTDKPAENTLNFAALKLIFVSDGKFFMLFGRREFQLNRLEAIAN